MHLDAEQIRRLYWQDKLSLAGIAKRQHVSAATVRNKMLKEDIPRRGSKRREIAPPPKNKLEKMYNAGLTLEKIGERFCVAPATVFRWMQKYDIPRRKMKYQKFPFSRDLCEKAYLLGLRCGDLTARQHCRQVLVEVTTTHHSMIYLFNTLFQRYGMPRSYPKYNNKTERYEWRVYGLLDKSFDFLLFKQFDVATIKDGNFYNFLAGFFDAEGCLYIYNNHGYVGLTLLFFNTDKVLLEAIADRLKKFGFNPKFHIVNPKGKKTTDGYFYTKDVWSLALHTNKEVIRILKLMPIRHDEKLRKKQLVLALDSNRWQDIKDQVMQLRHQIKDETKKCVAKAMGSWKNNHRNDMHERSDVLQKVV